MTGEILVVDQVLTTVAHGLSKDLITDYALSMTFANAAARPARSKASDGGAAAFGTEWTNILGQVGWILTRAGQTAFSSSATGETTTIAERLIQIGGTAAISGAVNALKSISESDESNSESDESISESDESISESDESISESDEPISESETSDGNPLAKMWWDAATAPGFLQAAVGALTAGPNDGPAFEVLAFTVDLKQLKVPSKGLFHEREKSFEPAGTSGLFASVLESSLTMDFSNVTATLNMEVFANARAKIVSLLGDKFTDHYRVQPASLI